MSCESLFFAQQTRVGGNFTYDTFMSCLNVFVQVDYG